MLEMVNDIKRPFFSFGRRITEEKFEETDPFSIVTEVAEKLKPVAAKKDIQILTEGETSIISESCDYWSLRSSTTWLTTRSNIIGKRNRPHFGKDWTANLSCYG